jgi:hypothetical protein
MLSKVKARWSKGGSLLTSALYNAQALACCGLSPAWELAEDPLPRLALFLPRQQALLVYRIPWDIHPPCSNLACLHSNTVIVAAKRLSLGRKSLGMRGFDMLGPGTHRILVSTARLCGSRHSRATRREAGWGIPAEASDEERILRNRLDGEVVNLPPVAGVLDNSSQLTERDSLPVITVPDHCCKGVVVCGVRTKRDLGQCWYGSSG